MAHGRAQRGRDFSMLTFLSKVAAGLSSLITMLGFAAVGFEGKEDSVATPQAVNCIEFMMYILPPLILLVALAIYFKNSSSSPLWSSRFPTKFSSGGERNIGVDPSEPV